jgi:hypothetical protein
MKDFDSIKTIYQQAGSTGEIKPPVASISKSSANSKIKLQREQLYGALVLILTALLIACMALFYNFNFQHWYTYGALVLVCSICIAQAALLLFTYKKIKRIDETASPLQHLQQWEAYYVFRKKQAAINMPVYFIALNLAMVMYLIEVLNGRPILNVIIFLIVYTAWMLFAYFYLGKKNLRKEDKRLQSIINELRSVEKELREESE